MTGKRRDSEPIEIIDEGELQQLENLRTQFEILDLIRAKMPAPPFPSVGSSLAGDDRWADPYHLSHLAVMSLGVALDQLKALENLIIGAQSVHPFATFSLIRSAIENGATALWLLSPTSRKERVTRRLRLLTGDAYNRDKLHKAIPSLADRLSLEDRVKKIRELADKHEIGKLERVQMTNIVREVGKIRDYSIEGAWQITSGVTHGQQWAILALLSKEIEDDTKKVVDVLLTTGLVPVVWGVECARLTIQKAHDLLTSRGASLIG